MPVLHDRCVCKVSPQEEEKRQWFDWTTWFSVNDLSWDLDLVQLCNQFHLNIWLAGITTLHATDKIDRKKTKTKQVVDNNKWQDVKAHLSENIEYIFWKDIKLVTSILACNCSNGQTCFFNPSPQMGSLWHFLDALASLDFTLVSESVSESVRVSNLK